MQEFLSLSAAKRKVLTKAMKAGLPESLAAPDGLVRAERKAVFFLDFLSPVYKRGPVFDR